MMYYAQSYISRIGLPVLSTLPEYEMVFLYFISLTLAYIITYSAIEADSPSLAIVLTINSAGSYGLEEEVLDKIMTNDILVKPRIRDLIIDKMVYVDGEKYKLTPKGLLLVRTFIFYRKILNTEKGG